MNKQTTAQKRIEKQKKLMLECLKKNPVVQAACEKMEVGRATYYRWCKEDPVFAKAADEAVIDGIALCNDFTESKLLSAIQEDDINAVRFWLRANHPRYKNKVEVNGKLTTQATFSPEKQGVVEIILKRLLDARSTQTHDTANEEPPE